MLMNQSPKSPVSKIIITVAVLAVLAIGAYVILTNVSKTKVPVASTKLQVATEPVAAITAHSPAEPAATPSSASAGVATNVYKNGTYTVKTDYSVPKEGINNLEVKVTIESDNVTVVSTNNSYEDRDSVPYINGFKSGVSGAVVGKKLSNLVASRIGGASLTSGAFNEVIAKIKSDAKS